MIKINLLPPHIHRAKQIKVAIAIIVVLLAGEIAGVLAMRTPLQAEEGRLNARKTELDGGLAQVRQVESAAGAVLGEETQLGPKYNFITEMLNYNTLYPDLYARTAGYTYREATFLNLEATANQLKFDAYVSDPADVARLMLGLSNSPDFTALPNITGVPNYDSAERREREAELTEANLPGSLIIGGAVAGADGAAGMGGGYPGAPGGGYPGLEGSPSMGGGAGYPGGAPTAMSMGMGASAGAGGYPGGEGGMGGGGAKGDITNLRLDTARQKPRGFTVTVTCALKSPITRPFYASSETQIGGSGGGGGGMGMGGYPGGAGGYPGGITR
jgi:hypothetical protein